MNYLPKIELHCHLDGSVRPSTVIDIAKREDVSLATIDVEEIEEFMVAKLNCASLEDYLEMFDIPNQVMQTSNNLERITYELLEDVSKENVKYIEVRFGPQLHREKGLSLNEVIKSVLSGIRRAEKEFDIKGNLILSSLRNHSLESLYDLIEAGKGYLGHGVVGLDLCAVEKEGFSKEYVVPFKLAKDYGYRITIHAGEACSGNNVLEAIELLGAERIGHGVHLLTSKEAYRVVKNKGTLLEMCPTSNVQTKAVKNYEAHPIMDFMRDDINVSISTDNRTVSGTTMSKEIEIVTEKLGMTLEEYKNIFIESINACFADNQTKNQLRLLADDIV